MTNKTAIEIKNLVKTYGSGATELIVIKNLSLKVEQGDFVALMGKSGAGKSTLLYQMSLLDHPNSGEIHLLEKRVDQYDEENRTKFRLENLGYIFQDYALVPELSAEENVALPLLMMGYNETEANFKARQTLDKVGLNGKANHLPNQLSGGQQQRVSIARAVAKNPAILFADEPTANLDKKSSHDVMEVLNQLHKEGQTIMMVTHEMEYTLYCNKIYRMEDGEISLIPSSN